MTTCENALTPTRDDHFSTRSYSSRSNPCLIHRCRYVHSHLRIALCSWTRRTYCPLYTARGLWWFSALRRQPLGEEARRLRGLVTWNIKNIYYHNDVKIKKNNKTNRRQQSLDLRQSYRTPSWSCTRAISVREKVQIRGPVCFWRTSKINFFKPAKRCVRVIESTHQEGPYRSSSGRMLASMQIAQNMEEQRPHERGGSHMLGPTKVAGPK